MSWIGVWLALWIVFFGMGIANRSPDVSSNMMVDILAPALLAMGITVAAFLIVLNRW